MGSSYSNIPKTTNVDNKTLEINQNQELQIKGGAVDTSILNDTLKKQIGFILYNGNLNTSGDTNIPLTDTTMNRIRIYFKADYDFVPRIKVNSETNYNWKNVYIDGSPNTLSNTNNLGETPLLRYYIMDLTLISSGEIIAFGYGNDTGGVGILGSGSVLGSQSNINQLVIDTNSDINIDLKVIGFKD